MIELLTLIILISLFCNGLFYLTTEEGMPLKFIDRWIDKRLDNKLLIFIYSPILGCITCMSSVWGTLLYWHFIGFTTESYYELPIVVISSAYLNTLMFNYVRKY